jgi:hypothetical protein
VKKWERQVQQAIAQGGCKVIERLKADGHLRFLLALPSGREKKADVRQQPAHQRIRSTRHHPRSCAAHLLRPTA